MATKPTSDDLYLFREYAKGAIPLKHDLVEPFHRHPPPRPLKQPDYNDSPNINLTLSESSVVTEDFLDFARPGVQLRVLQELRRGDIQPQLELDLHGLSVAYAQESMESFLVECRRRLLRCVRIIHGKGARSESGQPVLKCKVNYWLRCCEDVLAFTSTPRWDGGTGAVYVLLRNACKSPKGR